MKITPFVFLVTASFLFSNVHLHTETSINATKSNELHIIDQEILFLKNELKKMRKGALNNEMQAQPYMIDNWHEFAEEIKVSEENEKSILYIKKKIKELSEKRDLLIQQKAPHSL